MFRRWCLKQHVPLLEHCWFFACNVVPQMSEICPLLSEENGTLRQTWFNCYSCQLLDHFHIRAPISKPGNIFCTFLLIVRRIELLCKHGWTVMIACLLIHFPIRTSNSRQSQVISSNILYGPTCNSPSESILSFLVCCQSGWCAWRDDLWLMSLQVVLCCTTEEPSSWTDNFSHHCLDWILSNQLLCVTKLWCTCVDG